jgi:uncharacterized Zn finger protein
MSLSTDTLIARLERRRAMIDERLAQLREQQLKETIVEMRKQIGDLGLTAKDLFGRKPRGKK